MNIYELDNKGITKSMYDFRKTEFGKIVFFEAFCVPFLLIILSFFAFIIGCKMNELYILYKVPGIAGITILFFIIGHIYYMHELKEFINNKK